MFLTDSCFQFNWRGATAPDAFTDRPKEWQARRDSNPQHPVLETGALPVRATGLHFLSLVTIRAALKGCAGAALAKIVPKLLRFAMNRMMPAAPAELFRFQTLGILFLVLRHGVVAFLAIVALQRNDFSHNLSLASMAGAQAVHGRATFTE